MAKFATKFESKRQDWETPDEIFLPLDAEFQFVIDVCATEQNKKCSLRYTEEEDGLSQDWSQWMACWMNPPFGEQGKWVKKAYEESQKGTVVVCLLPSRTNTNWWHDYCMKGEIRFIKGRPKFKGAAHGLPQPLAVVIFRPSNNACTQQGETSRQIGTFTLDQLPVIEKGISPAPCGYNASPLESWRKKWQLIKKLVKNGENWHMKACTLRLVNILP